MLISLTLLVRIRISSTYLRYIAGTVKIHKPNHPLRPIISQIPIPIYQLIKTIKQLLSPYLPSKYSINLHMN